MDPGLAVDAVVALLKRVLVELRRLVLELVPSVVRLPKLPKLLLPKLVRVVAEAGRALDERVEVAAVRAA